MTTGNQVTVVSTGASTAPNDVSIQVTVNGQTSSPYRLTVRAPTSLEHAPTIFGIPYPDTHVPYRGAYASTIHYSTLDQFGVRLPARSSLPMNENFTTGLTRVFSGSNWTRGDAGGLINDPHLWADGIEPPQFSGQVPPPLPPCYPLCNVGVDYWEGEWFFGSASVGRGRRVQTNRWYRYQDHATHVNRVTPAP